MLAAQLVLRMTEPIRSVIDWPSKGQNWPRGEVLRLMIGYCTTDFDMPAIDRMKQIKEKEESSVILYSPNQFKSFRRPCI